MSFQTNVVKPPLVYTFTSPRFSFSCFGQSPKACLFVLGHTVLQELILCLPKSSKILGMKRHCPQIFCVLSLQLCKVKCLTVACVAVMSSVAECESLTQVHFHIICIPWFITEFVNFDAEMVSFLCNILPEDNPALEFYNYLEHCQMLWGVIEFSLGLVQRVKDSPLFPQLVIFFALIRSPCIVCKMQKMQYV